MVIYVLLWTRRNIALSRNKITEDEMRGSQDTASVNRPFLAAQTVGTPINSLHSAYKGISRVGFGESKGGLGWHTVLCPGTLIDRGYCLKLGSLKIGRSYYKLALTKVIVYINVIALYLEYQTRYLKVSIELRHFIFPVWPLPLRFLSDLDVP